MLILSIVLPEGSDERIIEAALKLKEDGIIEPIVIGSKNDLEHTGLTVIDPNSYEEMDELVHIYGTA